MILNTVSGKSGQNAVEWVGGSATKRGDHSVYHFYWFLTSDRYSCVYKDLQTIIELMQVIDCDWNWSDVYILSVSMNLDRRSIVIDV